jgi:hypothetical protein
MTRPTPIERDFASRWTDEHGVPATRDDLAQAFAYLRQERAAKVCGKQTWMSPYWDTYKLFMAESEPEAGEMARYFGPLHEKYGVELVAPVFRFYFQEHQGREEFCSLKDFKVKFGVWWKRWRRRV